MVSVGMVLGMYVNRYRLWKLECLIRVMIHNVGSFHSLLTLPFRPGKKGDKGDVTPQVLMKISVKAIISASL